MSRRILGSWIRLLIPLAVVAVIKILASLFIYRRLSILGDFYTPWMQTWSGVGPSQPWLYLYSAQDTGFYVAIAREWYKYPMYVFFPAYPTLIMFIGKLIGDLWLSAFIISFALGLASIPLLQYVAENYMDKVEAAATTILFATFPYIFLFTTISYTESLYLFSTLAAWLLHLKGRDTTSAAAAALSTLTKTYGIAIIIPVALNLIAKRMYRRLLNLIIPAAALLGWLIYLKTVTGEFFAFSTQQFYWMNLGVDFGYYEHYIKPFLRFNLWSLPQFHYLLPALIIFFAYLVFCTFKIDSKLGVYSLVLFLGLLYFSNFISMPRFFSFIFPVWLTAKIKNILALTVAVAFFILNSLLLWYQFLMAVWVS
ncbi:MAG: glycosyltransferase family 39 protein [Candidatus Bathyarchaeia archaeon]